MAQQIQPKNEIVPQSEFEIVKEALDKMADLKAKKRVLIDEIYYYENRINDFKERLKNKLTEYGFQSIKKENYTFYLSERVSRTFDEEKAIREIEMELKDKEEYIIYQPVLNQKKFLEDFPKSDSYQESKIVTLGIRQNKKKEEVSKDV